MVYACIHAFEICSVRHSTTLRSITRKDLFSTLVPSLPVVCAGGSHCDFLLFFISQRYFMHVQASMYTYSLSFFQANDSTLCIPACGLFKTFIIKCTLHTEVFKTYTGNLKNMPPMDLTPWVQNKISPITSGKH